ncbi:MAG: hypothetical protein ACR2PF_15200, partial [Rhizobiaceae bacterium]
RLRSPEMEITGYHVLITSGCGDTGLSFTCAILEERNGATQVDQNTVPEAGQAAEFAGTMTGTKIEVNGDLCV